MSDDYDLVTWGHDPRETAAAVLDRSRPLAEWSGEREPKCSTPYPREENPAGYVAVAEWYRALERWRGDAIGSPVMEGLGLVKLPWGPPPERLIAALVHYARSALHRIDALATKLRSVEQAAASTRTKLAASEATIVRMATEAAAERETARGLESHLRDQLGAARLDADEARQAAREAERDRDAARAQADAWRTSAVAAQEALTIMRTALRIPAAPVDAGLQALPGVRGIDG